MLLKSISPVNKFDYVRIKDNIYKIKLRTDILEYNNCYSYNQYEIITEITNSNIDEEIEINFEKYLELGKFEDEIKRKENLIKSYKKNLSNSDYQIIKTLENYSLGLTLPYDYSELISERQEMRDLINNLEAAETEDIDELAQCKSRKITEMCSVCQTTITSGIDYNNEHYRLNTTDQINLTSLGALAQQGKPVPYHADGQVCRIYSPEEMVGLVQAATQFITYHTTYFNLLKHTISDINDIDEVKRVEYGMELSSEYQTILNTILTQ